MIPVNVFPSVETILHCSGWMWQSPVVYCQLLMLQVIRRPNPGVLRTAAITSWILMAVSVFAVPTDAVNPVAQIQSVIRAQQDAWNRSDIDGFMNGYARSPSTVFVSEDTIKRGWETVRDRYREKYSDRGKMGTLTFSEIEITLLSPDSALVLGRWSLERAGSSARALHAHLQTPAGRLANCARSYVGGKVIGYKRYTLKSELLRSICNSFNFLTS
jgi:ketosteroid isomerase-like protein